MKETTSAAMPPCFDKWCQRFDDLFTHNEKKTELAIKLVDRTICRGYKPGIVIVDAGYGNNTSFLLELEKRGLKY